MKTVLVVLCLTLLGSSAQGGITVTSVNNIGDVSVDTTHLGSASDYQESPDPVTALAMVEDDLGVATAWASAAPFDISCYALVGLLPAPPDDHIGSASASALSVLVGLASDTPWRLDILTEATTDQSLGGQTALTGVVNVWDTDGLLVYGYDFQLDGLFATQVLPAGTFQIAFYGEAGAAATAGLVDSEYAEASLTMAGAVTAVPVPVPGAFLLGCLGATMAVRRFRRVA